MMVVLWLLFAVYWLIAAIGVKRNIRTENRLQRTGLRIALIVVILLFFRVPEIRQELQQLRNLDSQFAIQFAGLLLCVCGIGIAVWARLHLGRNWGHPMTLKAGHELVTSGPYRFVRHPIYMGILVAMLGSALVNPLWAVALVCATVYFVYCARTEERIMMRQFPIEYPEYRQRTKALMPFVW